MDGKVTLHRLTLQMGGLLSLAGLGLLSQEAQANAEILSPDPDLALSVALAPAHPVVEVPEPSAQPTTPEVDALDSQPAWAPSPDESAIAPSEPVDIALAGAAALPVTTPEEVPLATVEADLNGDLTAAGPDAIEIELEPAPPRAQSSDGEAGEPRPIAVAESPPAVDDGHGPAPTSAATPAAFPVAAPPSAQPPQAAVADSPSGAPAAESEPALASTAAAGQRSPAGHPISSKTPGTPTAAPRPTAPDMATLRARAETITVLLQDIRSTAGLEASLPGGAAAAPRQPVTSPETRGLGPQLPPIPSQRAGRRPLGADLEATDKPVKGGVTSAQSRREPQLPILPRLAAQPNLGAQPNVALALPAPQPVMTPTTTAQTNQTTPRPAALEPERLRDDLRIDPLTTAVTTYIPSSSAGIPTGFGAGWGDFFISATLAGADRLRPEADGSLYMGFGLGDAQRLVGVEIAYNLLSVRRFAENGSFDAKVHREIYNQDNTQIAGAVGVTSAFPYGSNAIGTEASFYGVLSSAHLLQPDHPTNPLTLNTTLGLGSGNFASGDVGILAGVGLRVHPQFAVNTAWSGVGMNVGASIVPYADRPITLNLLYGDIFNNTTAGSVAVISIGYGINSNARF